MSKNTFATRNFSIGDANVSKGDDLAGLPANQLRDFQLVGLAGAKPADPAPPTPPAKA